ncbi:MAG: LptF/LptG family permease [Elusimicrobiota bacterium]
MKIIYRYIIKEFFPKFFVSLLVFTFILLMDQLFDLTDLLLNKGAGLSDTLLLFLYILPSLFMFTVPMAILAGTLLLFCRLNDDNEITAIRTAGISIISVMKPVLIVSFFLSLIMLYFNSTVAPSANHKFKLLYYRILYKNPVMQLAEKSFVQLQNYDIYVKKITNDNILHNVLIYKWETDLPTITIAETAEMAIAEGGGGEGGGGRGTFFRLNTGTTLQENLQKIGDFTLCSFDSNDLILQTSEKMDFLDRRESGCRELNSSMLLKKAKTGPAYLKNSYITEYYLRYAIGWAGIIFVIIAVPLSLLPKKRAKSFGIAVTVGLIFVYYILLITSTTLGEKGFMNPIFAVWLPNFVIGLVGIKLTTSIAKK